jgi:hypothetical protein
VGFEQRRAPLEELLLPPVEHRGVDAVLIAQVGDGHVLQQVEAQGGHLLLGGEVLACLGHGALLLVIC